MAFSDSKHQMWLHENHIHEGFTVTAELIRLFFFLFFFLGCGVGLHEPTGEKKSYWDLKELNRFETEVLLVHSESRRKAEVLQK